MDHAIDIEPATVTQAKLALGGRMVLIEDDVQNVARDLDEIDSSLHLHFDPVQGVWVVMQDRDGTETLVTTALECDRRLVARVREVCAPGYDLARELEAAERAADRAHAAVQRERMGELGERMAHAFRRDLNERKNF